MGSMGQPPGHAAAAISSAIRSSSVLWPGRMCAALKQVLLLLQLLVPVTGPPPILVASANTDCRAPASHAPHSAAALPPCADPCRPPCTAAFPTGAALLPCAACTDPCLPSCTTAFSTGAGAAAAAAVEPSGWSSGGAT
eukprot:scaffold97423_cov17-Tisochrysis_lutea.AAC.1